MTSQYAGLRTLQEKYQDRGFTVLGFPCNQFGGQEPGTHAEIAEFAQSKYNVNFPLFAKVEVNGLDTCELYRLLKRSSRGGGTIRWNFTKFLVDGQGEVLERFEPRVTPEQIEPAIVAALA